MPHITCPKCGHNFELTEENSDYRDLLEQVRTETFEQELAQRSKQAADLAVSREREQAQKKSAAQQEAYAQEKLQLTQEKSELEQQINTLNTQLESERKEKENAVTIAVQKEQAQAQAALSQAQAQAQTALNQAQTKAQETLNQTKEQAQKDLSKAQLEAQKAKSDLEREKSEADRKLAEAQVRFDEQLKAKDLQIQDRDAEIVRINDMKARLNTKMLGESLEQHCEQEFNRWRAAAFPNAYFEKDNQSVRQEDEEKGSKGDYIFRDCDEDGTEIVSIMFEMKNQIDDARSKQKKNSDHFAKLDKDRRNKNCEYAVLVSLLEPENELYNDGIVDVSYQSGFEKMYVIRPQFFIPLITLIRNMAHNTLDSKKELERVRQENIDITNFEEALNKFTDGVSRDYDLAGKSFTQAIKAIEKSIAEMQKTRERLLTCAKHLGNADKKADRVSIKSLTRGNKTMKEKFAELKHMQDAADEFNIAQEQVV